MKKILSAIPTVLMLMCSVGCVDLGSFVDVVGGVETNLTHKASFSFASFKGSKTFNMKCSNASENTLMYSGKIASGDITVSYKNGDEKVTLFSIKGGEEVESTLEGLYVGDVYVILETNEKCTSGSFNFEIK